jgi:hypothetical protein
MVGHRVVSSAQFGVKTAGQLGNTQELEIASTLFDRQVLKPYQRILVGAVEQILSAAGTPSLVSVTEVEPAAIEEPEAVNMAEVMNIALDSLLESGQPEDMDGYELIDARKVDYDTEAVQDAMWTFANVPAGSSRSPKGNSKQDNEIIRVRYAYMPKVKGSQGVATYESRDFCSKMVSAGNVVWRKEDIDQASRDGVNGEWAPGGQSKYDIFLWKGGGSCQHFWERRTYLKKNNKKITVREARNIIREAGLKPLERNDPRVAKTPRSQSNRGFIKPQNIQTPV